MNNWLYINLEWISGSGKSSQINLISETLRNKYPNKGIVTTKVPWVNWLEWAIRSLVQWEKYTELCEVEWEVMSPWCNNYLYLAAQFQNIENIVLPALKRWDIVISDRGLVSNTAYRLAEWMNEQDLALSMYPLISKVKPLILYFDIDIETATKRTFDSAWDKYERMDINFVKRVQEEYEEIMEDWYFNVARVDANKSIEEVTNQCLEAIYSYLD